MSPGSNEGALNGLFCGTQWCRIDRCCYFKRESLNYYLILKGKKSLSLFFLYETYPVLLKQHNNIVNLIVCSCSLLSVNILLNIIMRLFCLHSSFCFLGCLPRNNFSMWGNTSRPVCMQDFCYRKAFTPVKNTEFLVTESEGLLTETHFLVFTGTTSSWFAPDMDTMIALNLLAIFPCHYFF